MSDLQKDGFASEYEFEFALYEFFQTTHDGHFRYLSSLVAGVFRFGRHLARCQYLRTAIACQAIYLF